MVNKSNNKPELPKAQQKSARSKKSNNNLRASSPQNDVSLKELNQSIARDIKLSQKQKNDMASLIEANKKEIMLLQKDLAKMKAASTKTKAPLAAAGSLLTGEIANAVQMLVNPGPTPSVPLPGVEKSSQVKGNFTPYKAIPLTAGKARIIGSPYGKYNVYVSTDIAGPNIAIGNNNVASPRIICSLNSTNNDFRVLLRCDQSPNGTNGVFSTVQTNFSVHLGALAWIGFTIPKALIGSTIHFAGVTVPIVEEGLYIWSVAGAVLPPLVVVNTPVAIGTYNDLNIAYNFAGSSTQEEEFTISVTDFISSQSMIPGLDTYLAWTAPSLQQIRAGSYDNDSLTIAASLLLGSDAAMINNGGYLNAASMTTRAYPPPGVNFEDYISSQTSWFYKGALKDGCYQIYVPQAELKLLSTSASDKLTPWTGDRFYNMVITLDNSFDNGGGVPRQTQAHLTYESVISTTSLSNIIPPAASVEDPGYRVAISLLKKYYNPCCNPDHFDHMVDWMGNTFSKLQEYGSRVINSPITKDVIRYVVDEGIPLAAGVATKVAPLLASLLL